MANKVKASHILVEKYSQAEKIYDQATKNNFANLAKNFSNRSDNNGQSAVISFAISKIC